MNEKQRNLFTGELEPTAKHRDDIVECSDGTTCTVFEAFEDIEGKYHSCESDRFDREKEIVENILLREEKSLEEYATENDDFADGYAHIVDETSYDWPRYVENWIRDTYPHPAYLYACKWDKDTIDKIVDLVCEEMSGSMDCEAVYNRYEYVAYSGDGCCLWGFDIGEQEHQIEISGYDKLQALEDCERLDDCLDALDREFCIKRSPRSDCFEIYFYPGGRWDFVVPADRMRQLVTEAILKICQK